MAPAVNASEKEISVSLGVVFLLNAVALVVFPFIGHLLGLSQHQFGLWSAIAIHDTSSVVGRALWIIPVSLLSAFLFKNKGKKISIPWFILFFILAMLANSYLPGISTVAPAITAISKSALVVTLFLIGAGLSVEKIKSVGWKPLILGIILWITVSILSLLVIMHY